MDLAILIGYFARQDEARKALRELAQLGFGRAALAHKSTDGDIHIADPFLRRRALGVILATCLSGGIGGLAAVFRQSYARNCQPGPAPAPCC